jgi:hypothetical protein
MVRVDYKTILSIDRVSILQRAFGSQDKTSGSAVNKNKNVDSKHKQEVLYYRMNPLSCVCEDTNDYYK